MRIVDAIFPPVLASLAALVMSSSVASAQRDAINACAYAKTPDAKIAACGRAISRGAAMPRQHLAILYLNRCATYYSIHEYDSAIRDCNASLRLSPGYEKALGARSAAYLRKGDHEQGLRDAIEASRRNPGDLDHRNNMAFGHFLQGDFSRTIDLTNEIVRRNPKYAFAYKNRGLAYEKLNHLDAALADFRMAIRLDPGVLDAREGIGRIEQQRQSGATAAATSAVAPPMAAAAPPAAPAEFDICFSQQDAGTKLKACADLITSGKVRGRELALAYGERGSIFFRAGNFDSALAEFNEALKAERGVGALFHHRAAVFLQTGAHQPAINDLDEAIRLDPRDASAFYNRGVAKLGTGDTAGGNADLAEAKRLDPRIGN